MIQINKPLKEQHFIKRNNKVFNTQTIDWCIKYFLKILRVEISSFELIRFYQNP